VSLISPRRDGYFFGYQRYSLDGHANLFSSTICVARSDIDYEGKSDIYVFSVLNNE